MTRPEVQAFTRKAEKVKEPGLFGIFGETDLVTATLWCYLEEYAATCEGVVMNTVQEEVTFPNGAQVRVFCSGWRTYHGLSFDDILITDESIRGHVYSKVKKAPEGGLALDEAQPTPVFGL